MKRAYIGNALKVIGCALWGFAVGFMCGCVTVQKTQTATAPHVQRQHPACPEGSQYVAWYPGEVLHGRDFIVHPMGTLECHRSS